MASSRHSNIGSLDSIGSVHLPYLDILIKKGYQAQRAMKALVVTGLHGLEKAEEWLSNHDNDDSLDLVSNREYFLYLVPRGTLLEQIVLMQEFSKKRCGWNGAHDYLPHIKLLQPFTATDDKAAEIIASLSIVLKKYDINAIHIKMEPYISQNYMGFYIRNGPTEYIKTFCQHFVNAISIKGITIDDENLKRHKPFHLTLAHKFHQEDFIVLKSLIELIDISSESTWNLALFARDLEYASHRVYKVIRQNSPLESNELPLILGDFIYVKEDPPLNDYQLVKGKSWLTGLRGNVEKRNIERAALTETWTKFRIRDDCIKSNTASSKASRITPFDGSQFLKQEIFIKSEEQNEKKILIMRHGERVDFTFPNWMAECFNNNGDYKPIDLNMPKILPKRTGGHVAFSKDSPLTIIGEIQARLTGEAMIQRGVKIEHVFVSPSLRCVQTAHHVLCGMGLVNKIKIKIEPGLFEWTAWYPEFLPDWMTNEELKKSGYSVDSNYFPILRRTSLEKKKETIEEVYSRSLLVTTTLLNKTKYSGGNILLIGHSITLDVCSRQFVGKQPRTFSEISKILPAIPYCSVICLHQNHDMNWSIKESGLPPITHSSNMLFDPSILIQ